MAFISYAQNFEDVMLWRALQEVPRGFFIDIGALDPIRDSVGKAFHDRGWRGLHVEPCAAYAERLREAFPGDDIREVALGAVEETRPFYIVPGTGYSTAVPELRDEHEASGLRSVETRIPFLTLDRLLENVSGPVHWMKIDAEGWEPEILEGWKTSPVRPWILVIESTRPNSSQPRHESWEPALLEKGYHFAWFDGLNRFYVSVEHSELLARLSVPPNVFDNFQRHVDLSVQGPLPAEPAEQPVEEIVALAARRIEEAGQKQREAEARLELAETVALRAEKKSDRAEARAGQLEFELRQAEEKSIRLQRSLQESEVRVKQADEELRALRARIRWGWTQSLPKWMRPRLPSCHLEARSGPASPQASPPATTGTSAGAQRILETLEDATARQKRASA